MKISLLKNRLVQIYALEKPEKVLEFFKPKKIVLDASNSYYNIQNFKAKFEEENLDYYIVPEKGAFEWKL